MAGTDRKLTPRKSSREKVQAYRARLRAQGLRPVTFWLPDTRTAEFKAEAARQGLLAARAAGDAEINAFIESVTDWLEDDRDVPDYE